MARRSTYDPLSIFLGVSVCVLLAMYFFDDANTRAINEHARAVEPLVKNAPEACVARAVGLQGDEALIECEGMSADQAREVIGKTFSKDPPPERFQRFSFRGPSGTLRCPRDLTECATIAPKDRAFYQEARRRRPRTERQSPGG